MIPELNEDLLIVEAEALPSLTYKIDLNSKHIARKIDGKEAMMQAVWKILNTERYSSVIYSSQYGIELERLIGKDYDFIKSDLKRTIEDALFVDDRVLSVEDFEISRSGLDSMIVSFIVITNEGNNQFRMEVPIS